MTILTREANCAWQLDKCYVIVKVAWVVLGVPNGDGCSDPQ